MKKFWALINEKIEIFYAGIINLRKINKQKVRCMSYMVT